MTFDAESIMNATITPDEAEGKKTLTPEGNYPECVVKNIQAYEPHERAKERGVQARLRVEFECPTSDVDLTTFMNFKTPIHSKSTYGKLVRAVWEKETAADKTTQDLVGETVNVSVFHEETNIDGRPISYAEYRFTKA
jgi:hypothetical protein